MDLDADYYKNHSQQQYDRARSLFTQNDFTEEANILDVGCGDGKITAEIAALVPKGRVLGIDVSPNMVQLAKNSFNFPNLKFQCMKAEEIEIEDSFDNIFCFNCLLWIRKPKQALEKLAKILRPEGKIVILTYLKESAYVDILEETLDHFPSYKKLSVAQTMLSAEDHRFILESNGLLIQEFEISKQFTYYYNERDLFSYLKGWIRSYVPIPMEDENRFLQMAVDHCLRSKNYRDKNRVKIYYKSLIIKAAKPSI